MKQARLTTISMLGSPRARRVVGVEAVVVWLLASACFSPQLAAQEGRDPTVAPFTAPTQNAPSALPGGQEGVSVIVRDGKAGLVVGTRVVMPGQRVSRWVLERITDTEVWLRDGKQVRKIPRFSGITRRNLDADPACEASAAASTAPSAQTRLAAKKSPVHKKMTASSPKAERLCDASLPRSSPP
jgi:hypothetical protein